MTEPVVAEQSSTEAQADQASTDSSLVGATEQTKQEAASTGTQTASEVVAAAPRAPETYELKGPEGQNVDQKIHDAYAEVAREMDLPQDAAQGMLNKTMQALQERAADLEVQKIKGWRETALKDSEYGGDKFDENVGTAMKGLEAFASDELRGLLSKNGELDGIGNHPEMVRMLVKIGKLVSEDTFVDGGKGGNEDPESEEAIRRKYYPNTK